MSLDLSRTIAQVRDLATRMRGTRDDRASRLRRAVQVLSGSEREALKDRAKRAENKTFFLAAEPLGEPGERHAAPHLPPDYTALSVDGSHIDVERHLAARCYVINIGACMLTYGLHPDATLVNEPTLYATDEQLAIRNNQDATQEEHIQGALLGIKRTVEEFKALADFAKLAPATPTVAFVDGSLILWELGGSPNGRFPDYVRSAMLQYGMLPAFDALRKLSSSARPLALCAYVSLPNGSEVANTTRLALCTFPVADCRLHCKAIKPGQRQCDAVHNLVDRDLMVEMLVPGERSAIFRTRLAMVREYGDDHQVCFFYLNVGNEIARIEIPQWVADDRALLDLVHAAALDQARRGDGYPPVIQEAHEQAVISTEDRAQFRMMVDEALEGERLPAYTSEKQRSKRFRWV
ncbi:MAG: DNA double-strand break repair nuclease NurA [Dehalococcoidia bacterium]|nr:DNA double-strand break repair nuclease NurA [Dehalococcoidia bacterium]